MNNKILIEVIVPLLEENFEIYIPVNKRISTVIKLIEKNILDVDKYIDAKINLDKVQDAYLELISGNTDKIKIVVKP